jgi:monoamine oxidase
LPRGEGSPDTQVDIANLFDAIVVGAGAAGLMASRELARAGKDVCVLEASNRVGGRIMTVYDTNAGTPLELGAEFVHGDAPVTTRLLDEARLITVPVLGKQYRSDHGELSPQGPLWERLAKVFEHLDPERKKDRSFQDFLDDKPGGARLKRERELAHGFVQGFFGADTTMISEKSLAQAGDPTEGASESRRVVNGYAALIDYLKRDVAQRIRMGVVVRRVVRTETDLRVFDQRGDEYQARAVIITVPLPMLQDETIAIEPGLPKLLRAAQQLMMGNVTHVKIVVKERFWEKKAKAISYVHAPERPFSVWWTKYPLLAPVITGWAGGPPALHLAESDDVEGSTITELARVFAMQRGRVESLVESIQRHDWTHDPNFRGAYSYAGVGGSNASRALARGFDDRIFLAGEATDSGSSGTVEGALATGTRAALKVLKTLAS